jgi:hypothetical protein
VDGSRIWAVEGPAVGIDARSLDTSGAAPLNITVTGLRLTARNSDLRSTGTASAAVLGVTATATSTSTSDGNATVAGARWCR